MIKPMDLREAGPGFQLVLWHDLGADDEGAPFDAFANVSGVGYSNFTFQVDGVLAGASVEIVGSVIPDKFNVIESFPVSDIKAIPPVDNVKPMVVGGNKDTKVTVGLLATR